jgi:DNA ligase (NAD+)
VEYVLELKYDGVAVSLIYQGGRFKYALSRGDGIEGEDISKSILATVKNIPTETQPLFVIYQNERNSIEKVVRIVDFEVRGEAITSKDEFQRLNIERRNSSLKEFKNARNFTAGLMNLEHDNEKDSNTKSKLNTSHSVLGKTTLDLIAYSLHPNEEICSLEEAEKSSKKIYLSWPPTHYQNLQILSKLGFQPDPHAQLCRNLEEVNEFLEKWESFRKNYKYNLDGVVIKLNSLQDQEMLGNLTRAPRWAMAYKFPSEKVKTTIQEIILKVSKISCSSCTSTLIHILPHTPHTHTLSPSFTNRSGELEKSHQLLNWIQLKLQESQSQKPL